MLSVIRELVEEYIESYFDVEWIFCGRAIRKILSVHALGVTLYDWPFMVSACVCVCVYRCKFVYCTCVFVRFVIPVWMSTP